MDNILKENFEKSLIKNNQQKKGLNVNCNYQIFNEDISPTFSFKIFSVDKKTILKKVEKFKNLVQNYSIL